MNNSENNKNIIYLLHNSINSLTNNDKYNIKLEENTIKVIKNILDNNPEFFDNVEIIFNQIISLKIIKDEKINIELFNIAQICKYVKKILDNINKLNYINDILNIDIFSNLIKFIFNLLIEENKENIENHEIILLNIIKVLDGSIAMIKIFY